MISSGDAMYAGGSTDLPLSQGDIFDDCPIVALDEAEPAGAPSRGTVKIIVLTQACDLAQAKRTRVIVAVVHDARVLVETGVLKAATIRESIRRGQTFGLYFLPAAPAPIELIESVVDLHNLPTIPRRALELLAAEGKRVCRLQTPFREHLAQHFGVTYMRIGLPEPYTTEP